MRRSALRPSSRAGALLRPSASAAAWPPGAGASRSGDGTGGVDFGLVDGRHLRLARQRRLRPRASPTTSTWSSRTGRSRSCVDDVEQPAPFLDITNRTTTTRGEQGLLGRLPPRLPVERPRLRLLHDADKAHRRSPSSTPWTARTPTSYPRARSQHPTPLRENHNGGQIRSAPTATCTSPPATAARAATRGRTGRTRKVCSGKLLRIDPLDSGADDYRCRRQPVPR